MSLGVKLIENGIIQFGVMQAEPFLFRFDLLPSYPNLLREISRAFSEVIQPIQDGIERIYTTADMAMTGLAISQLLDMPLVYSRGQGESPTLDLIGAYDVGHPAVLLTGVYADNLSSDLKQFEQGARGVGLHTHLRLAIIALQDNPEWVGLITREQFLDAIETAISLPLRQTIESII